jgi:hypothetical protein
MLKFLKELFLGKPVEAVQPVTEVKANLTAPEVESAPYKVPEPAAVTPCTVFPVVEEVQPVTEVKADPVSVALDVEEVQPVTEVKADPVSVALDLEPIDFATATIEEKKLRKPKAPKTADTAPVKKTDAKKPAAIKAPSKRGPKKAK